MQKESFGIGFRVKENTESRKYLNLFVFNINFLEVIIFFLSTQNKVADLCFQGQLLESDYFFTFISKQN